MAEPVSFVTDKTRALVDEHAARFSVMVNAGQPPATALCRTLAELQACLPEHMRSEGHVALLLWSVVVDALVELGRKAD